MKYPVVIASYPRSGSTWLRFVLCNLFYPDRKHDFESVNHLIPPIDHPEGLLAGVQSPLFYKTHGQTHATNVIFLFRHVGDVLESEWWYKKKMAADTRELREFVEQSDYGAGWRQMVEFYFPARLNISYRDLDNPNTYVPFDPNVVRIFAALQASKFSKMQQMETDQGLGGYPTGDSSIKFCRRGIRGQWREWPQDMQETLLQKNAVQLKKLGYEWQ